MNEKELALTREGLRKLEEELDDLKTVHRREVNERIRQAKEFGDISENADYEDAKQEQGFVEGRILKVEAMICNARIIDASLYSSDEVHLGATVKGDVVEVNTPRGVTSYKIEAINSTKKKAAKKAS